MHDRKFIDLTGKIFGRLTVIRPIEKTKDFDYKWECLCSCGKTAIVRGKSLKAHTTQSCGCYRDECASSRKHDGKGTRLYNIWKSMRRRCNDPHCASYKYYGARGITIAKQWDDFAVFKSWATQSGYKDDLSIDRIDVNGPYCPDNCRWVTKVMQANNTRRNRYIEYKGERYTLAQLSSLVGIKSGTIARRLKNGWPLRLALTIPPIVGRNQYSEIGEDEHPLEIKVKYHTDGIEVQQNPQGDWIDLKAAADYEMKQGEMKIISLGVSLRLPKNYEGHLAPRSSTFSKFGLLQVNGVGVIDESYCGENDIWGFPALAMRDTTIHKGDRICQFRIMKKMEPVEFVTVDRMEDPSRGGFGSTGT